MRDDADLTDVRFRQLVFSGGGTRCFWQGGFLEVCAEPLELAPERIAAVSGGALSACCHVGGRGRVLLDIMGSAFADQDHNVEREGSHATPHQELYRRVVEEALTDEAVAAVANGPALTITLAAPPKRLPLKLGAFLALALYEIDQHTRSSPHMALPVSAGTKMLRIDARQAARDGKLRDLVCAAAVIPPVFDLPEWEGTRVMDAGTTDNAPIPQADDGDEDGQGPTLILLTRRYRNTPDRDDRLYVPPSDETPADKIDFTDRAAIEKTWRLGREDGKAFLKRHGLT